MQAFEEALAPRLCITGQTGALQQFGDFISSRSLAKGSTILMLWPSSGTLEVLLAEAGQAADFSQARTSTRVQEPTGPFRLQGRATWKVQLQICQNWLFLPRLPWSLVPSHAV